MFLMKGGDIKQNPEAITKKVGDNEVNIEFASLDSLKSIDFVRVSGFEGNNIGYTARNLYVSNFVANDYILYLDPSTKEIIVYKGGSLYLTNENYIEIDGSFDITFHSLIPKHFD